MNIIFMGTPAFAVPCLEELIKSEYNVVGVFTQPDKPQGRKQVLTAPPVKVTALENGIPVFQPVSLKTTQVKEEIEKLNADMIVVVAYGKILPKDIMDIPKFGCVNVHASLLPLYRGSAPIHWAIINGESKTGITTMLMDEGIDTGDILLTEQTDILPLENSAELYDRISKMGANLLIPTIKGVFDNSIVPIKQNSVNSTYFPMLTKALSPINWNNSSEKILNQIRGLHPWPIASTFLQGKTLKIFSAKAIDIDSNCEIGKVVFENKNLIICCGDRKFIELLEVQYEGSKRMAAIDFLKGHKLQPDTVLGI